MGVGGCGCGKGGLSQVGKKEGSSLHKKRKKERTEIIQVTLFYIKNVLQKTSLQWQMLKGALPNLLALMYLSVLVCQY